ncbi:hypothetical protein JHN59_11505 [Streptomyces sp. MBT49]|uniref:hypothetical protein n=1 Tax=unclassified Streptomyces TaxID=2593676 RepID=UPI00190CBE8C|nr:MULTISPECIES: hypothetical protein [unclassified Streptomyces]MBK3625461.1 hypothetical protein [Streptomyces sp. MBT49]MBK3633276.1 hypothetical protein [Streptomyces sp. MBT97]
MTETFGPEYVKPQPQECPDCACCFATLCERGQLSTMRCAGLTDASTMGLVSGCPCSAETTAGTHAWRAARIRITRHATQRPLHPAAALLLRFLETPENGPADDPEDMLGILKAYGYAGATEDGRPAITEFGRRYLQAAAEPRCTTLAQVVSVDVKARTVVVLVVGWSQERTVTVLLDQLAAETGITAEALPGQVLRVEANCRAATAEEVVLTKVSIASALPEGWMDGSVPDGE